MCFEKQKRYSKVNRQNCICGTNNLYWKASAKKTWNTKNQYEPEVLQKTEAIDILVKHSGNRKNGSPKQHSHDETNNVEEYFSSDRRLFNAKNR